MVCRAACTNWIRFTFWSARRALLQGPLVRHERREFGTAVFSRVQGDRRTIYTGRWALVIRGLADMTAGTTARLKPSGPTATVGLSTVSDRRED